MVKQAIYALIMAVSLHAPVLWADQVTVEESTDRHMHNLSGTWVVTPKNGNYGPSFAIGEVILTQYGQDIEGIFLPSATHQSAMDCSKGPYKVNGRVEGSQVSLSAVGPGSTLTGKAVIETDVLSGDAIEVFQNAKCSGAVSGKFSMKRI